MALWAILISFLLPSAASAEVYKWREPNGVMRYSDVPPPTNVKLEAVQGRPATALPALPPLTPVKGNITAEQQRTPVNQPKETPLAGPATVGQLADAGVKQKNCKTALANKATYALAGRIARVNDKGERYFLTDADLAQAKLDAQADIQQYCE